MTAIVLVAFGAHVVAWLFLPGAKAKEERAEAVAGSRLVPTPGI